MQEALCLQRSIPSFATHDLQERSTGFVTLLKLKRTQERRLDLCVKVKNKTSRCGPSCRGWPNNQKDTPESLGFKDQKLGLLLWQGDLSSRLFRELLPRRAQGAKQGVLEKLPLSAV